MSSTGHCQVEVATSIRRAARLADLPLTRLAREAEIAYPRLLRILNGERRAHDGELARLFTIVSAHLAARGGASDPLLGDREAAIAVAFAATLPGSKGGP